MKKNYLLNFAVTMMSLLATTATAQQVWEHNFNQKGEAMKAPAASSSEMNIGYVEDDSYIYENDGIGGFPEDLRAGAAIKLDKSTFGKYTGAEIVSLAIGYSAPTGTQAEIFFKEELPGENKATGQGELQFGWNSIDFDTPVKIAEDMEEFYVGFYATLPANNYAIPVQRYAIVPNSCYLWTEDDMSQDGKEMWKDWYLDYGMVMIKATIRGEDGQFDNMLVIQNMHNYDTQVIGDENGYAIYTVTNYGMNMIDKIGIVYEMGENKYDKDIELDKIIMPGTSVRVNLPIPAFGSGELKVKMARVNGEENKMANEMSVKVWGVTQEAASKYQRRPVVEFFESETSGLIPQYFGEYFMPGFEPYKEKISIIARHCDDQFQIRDNEDLRLLLDLVNNDSTKVYIPSVSVDRMDILASPLKKDYGPVLDIIFPDFVAAVYNEALTVPTFVSVNIDSNYSPEDNTAKITVSGHIEEGVITDGEPLFLSLFITESKVDASSQTSKDPIGDYTHSNVIRLQPTPMYGDQLNNNSGDYSKTYEVELEEDWKKEDMKIIACINRGEQNSHYDKEILNTAELDFNKSSVADTYMKDNSVRVFGADGKVMVEGQYDDVTVYDIAGKAVENKDLNGYYIVRVKAGDSCTQYKVIVK